MSGKSKKRKAQIKNKQERFFKKLSRPPKRNVAKAVKYVDYRDYVELPKYTKENREDIRTEIRDITSNRSLASSHERTLWDNHVRERESLNMKNDSFVPSKPYIDGKVTSLSSIFSRANLGAIGSHESLDTSGNKGTDLHDKLPIFRHLKPQERKLFINCESYMPFLVMFSPVIHGCKINQPNQIVLYYIKESFCYEMKSMGFKLLAEKLMPKSRNLRLCFNMIQKPLNLYLYCIFKTNDPLVKIEDSKGSGKSSYTHEVNVDPTIALIDVYVRPTFLKRFANLINKEKNDWD